MLNQQRLAENCKSLLLLGEYLGSRKFSTSLDKSTDSVAQVLGEDNFTRMKPAQVNQRIFELTNPKLAAGYKTLPKRVRDSIDKTLTQNHNISADIQFKTAKEKFNKNLYEGIGKELNTLGEFNQVQKSLGSNPSAQGSIGNSYAQKGVMS
jgi:hypothetical protein